jgi:hypothetical protein
MAGNLFEPGKSSCPAANRTAHSLPSVYGKASTHPPGAPAFFLKPLKAKQLHASSAFNCSFQVEWCWDWHGIKYYATSPGTDPRGPAAGSNRILRGGSGSYDADSCRVAYRNYFSPGAESGHIGFRLVRAAP